MRSLSPRYPTVALGALACLGLTSSSDAQQLTGAIIYAAATDGTPNTDGWNTLGGDLANNIYLKQGAGFINGPGDGADARINVNLTAPGTYTFTMFGDGGTQNDHHALNLFFDGNDTTPRISALAATDTTGTTTAFTANGNVNSRSLNYSGSVAAANTLSFSELGRTITLTAFQWSAPSVANQDIVGHYSTTPNSQLDYTGTFTLNVTAAATPEPGSLALLVGMGLSGAALFARRRKHTRNAS